MTRSARVIFAGVSIASALLATVACSTFSETPVDVVEGQETGPGDSTTPPAPDGGTDAGAGGDAACTSTKFCECQPKATFCADFDVADPFALWNQKSAYGGGTLSLAPSTRSAPNGILVTAPASPGGSIGSDARLTKNIVGNVSEMSVAFDIAPTAIGANGSVVTNLVFVEVLSSTGAASGRFGLLVTGSGPKVYVKNGANEYTDLFAFPNTKPWTRFTMQAHAQQLVVRYDDEPASAAPPIPFVLDGASITLTVGATSGAGANDTNVLYDNVVVSLGP